MLHIVKHCMFYSMEINPPKTIVMHFKHSLNYCVLLYFSAVKYEIDYH